MRLGRPLPVTSRPSVMSLANLLLRKHSTIAAVLFPVSVGVGFFYTVKTGRTAAAGLREALTGATARPSPRQAQGGAGIPSLRVLGTVLVALLPSSLTEGLTHG